MTPRWGLGALFLTLSLYLAVSADERPLNAAAGPLGENVAAYTVAELLRRGREFVNNWEWETALQAFDAANASMQSAGAQSGE